MSIFSRRMSSLIANDVRSVRLPSGRPGKRPVEVPAVLVREVLRRRVVHEGERVRPLLERARLAVADAVRLLAPRRLHVEERRVRVAEHALRARRSCSPARSRTRAPASRRCSPSRRRPSPGWPARRGARRRGSAPTRRARPSRTRTPARPSACRGCRRSSVLSGTCAGERLGHDHGLAVGPQRADVLRADDHQRQRGATQQRRRGAPTECARSLMPSPHLMWSARRMNGMMA